MILSHEKILGLVKKENLIENFSLSCLEGAGYDLRVGKIYKIKGSGFIGAKEQKKSEVEEEKMPYILKPNEYVLIKSIEKVNMPKNLIARILPRSSLFRMGCYLVTAVVDPGFKGALTMGLKNFSEKEFKFEKGAKIAQIIFEEVYGKTKLYGGRYQGGKIV